jgi:predicted nucleotide-binding protein (sugar kinase/HSP70/actin superfamily)
MREKDKLAIPNLGNYTIALDSAVRAMGIEPWSSTATGTRALELGIAAAPESLCLPFKAHLGHFIEADNAGCGHALMVNSMGTCRLSYYREMIEYILKNMGRKIRVWGLGFDGLKPPVIRYFDPPLIPFVRAVLLALEKIRVIDILETLAWEARPRENHRGSVSALAARCFRILGETNTRREVRALGNEFRRRFVEIPRKALPGDPAAAPPKIGLIGEISLLRDKTLNRNTEEILGNLGAEVRNFFLLGAELGNIFGFPLRENHAHTRQELAKVAAPWLGNPVGGHALDSVAHTLLCAGEGYDGMVHLCPAGCMPEVSVRPIIAAISREKDIPVLELSFDEHTSSVGLITRLEAFTDILRERRRQYGAPGASAKRGIPLGYIEG